MYKEPFLVLMAEDNEHDIIATRRAWKKHHIANPLYIVNDGEECLDFLYRRGRYKHGDAPPHPGILLLDINMPKMDGLSVLEYIRNDGSLRCLPVIVLIASEAEEDRLKSYNLGANAHIVKPVKFENLSEVVRTINLPDVAIWPFVIEISIVISHFSTFNTCNPCMTYRGLISNRWHSDTLTTPVLHPPA